MDGRSQPARAAPAPAVAVPEVNNGALDRTALDNILGLGKSGGAALLRRVIEIYLKNAPELIAAMNNAVGASDLAALGKAAHSLKSSSMNLGAARLAGICREIEATARSNSPESAARLAAAAEAEYIRVKALLREELDSLAP